MPKIEELQQTPGRHSRRARSLRVASSLAEINIVPLVDVMLVLLVIFMVTAPMMQQGFGIHLPQAKNSTAVSAPVTVYVPISFRADGKVSLQGETVRLDVLDVRVRMALSDKLEKQVIVSSDGRITIQELMQVGDKLQQAGVEKFAIQTQPPNQDRPK
jgi:biopolymer transport protein ExbD